MATTTPAESTQKTENLPAPSAALTPSARNKAAILAEMAAAESEAPAKEEKPAKVAPEPEQEEAEVEAEAEEPEAEPEPEEAEDEDAEDAPETAKGMERLKAWEKRARLALDKREQEIEQRAKAVETDLAELAEFKKLKSRIHTRPWEVLRVLGVGEDKQEAISEVLFKSSAKGLADPRNKDFAEKFAKERETEERLREFEEWRARADAEREQEKAERLIGEYLDTVTKHVTDESPRVAKLLSRSPQQARADLRQVADIMAQEGADIRDHRKVVRMLEAVMQQEYEELYDDAPTPTPAKPKAKSATQPDPKPAESTTKAPTRARRSDVLRELESL